MIPVLHGVWAAAGGLVGDFEHIETQTVGTGSPTSVTFSSIPSTYKHLQIRSLVLNSGTSNNFGVRFNGDTGNNYASHQVQGNGASTASNASTTAAAMYLMGLVTSTTTYPFVSVIDVLDYTSTSKYKTIRGLSGQDGNGTGTATDWRVQLSSGLWMSTSAVNSITLREVTFAQHSTISLYGVK